MRDWDAVHAVEFDAESSRPERTSPPVRRLSELAVERIWTSPSGKTLVDFGQNLVGFVRVRVTGPAGTEVVLRHAEVLEHDELGTRPLRRAEATDRFILSGGDDVFEPTLTFHGFRYAEVTGWPGEFDPAALTAVVVGHRHPSDRLVRVLRPAAEPAAQQRRVGHARQLPERADRLPAARRATGLDRRPRGLRTHGGIPRRRRVVPRRLAGRCRARAPCDPERGVPVVVPNVMKYLDTGFPEPGATAVWGDAAVWVPWALWTAYGHEQTLRDAYPLMTAHTRSVAGVLSPSGLWDTGFQFGDWLDPDAPADDPGKSKAPAESRRDGVRLPHGARSWLQAAEVLGEQADAEEFARAARPHRRGVPRALRRGRPGRE